MRPCLNYALAAGQLANDCLTKKLPNRWLSSCIGGVLFLSMLLQTDIVFTIRLLHWLGYVFLFLGILFPVFLLILSGKKVSHDQN